MYGVAGDDPGVRTFAEHFDVHSQDGERLPVLLDEYGLGGAARERFETERAGAFSLRPEKL